MPISPISNPVDDDVAAALSAGASTGDAHPSTHIDQVAYNEAVETAVNAVITLSEATAAAQYLPISGGTLTGLLTLSGAPTADLHTATKKYVDDAATQVAINPQTGTSYTLVLADAGKLVTVSSAATHTLTVPPNSSVAFPAGTVINLLRRGAGKLQVAQGAGVTIESMSSNKFVDPQYGPASLTKLSNDVWHLGGRLASA